jgi:nickel-dependent lactate racemase
LNGFGGGGKILFPGVADFGSILEHHLKYGFRGGSELGRLEGNPFYDEVCHMARSGGLDFIINSVMDHNDRLFEVVCGDPIKAHGAGAGICRDIISLPFNQKADITIISAFPYSEGPQIMKPLAPASMITKEGGVIILAAHTTSPLPGLVITGCERFRTQYPGRLRECLFQLFDQNQRIIDKSAPEHNMCMSQALLAQNDHTVILLSDHMDRGDVERLGFRMAENMDQAFAMATDIVADPDVHVVPAGGVILPLLENPSVWA